MPQSWHTQSDKEPKLIALIVPAIVIAEFRRNRKRIEKVSARSLSVNFTLITEAVRKAGGGRRGTKTAIAIK